MTRPTLTDRTALTLHRARASRMRGGMVDFLHRAVAAEIDERLEEVNRQFTEITVVSGFPELWAELLPAARQIPDVETLALEEGTQDLIVHALALHWADDPVGQLLQCRRSLKPDGMFLAASFGGETLAGLRKALAQAEVAAAGGLSPRVAPMGEIRDLGGLMQRAGFALPVADSLPYEVRYQHAFHLMADLRAMERRTRWSSATGPHRHGRSLPRPPRSTRRRARTPMAASQRCSRSSF